MSVARNENRMVHYLICHGLVLGSTSRPAAHMECVVFRLKNSLPTVAARNKLIIYSYVTLHILSVLFFLLLDCYVRFFVDTAGCS